MTFQFNAAEGLIYVEAELTGPTYSHTANLALDTGASRTILRAEFLQYVGYSPETAVRKINITTGSRVENGVEISIRKLSALGRVKKNISIVTHALPKELKLDGILGLDFFRGLELKIDFRKGQITLK